MNKAFIVGVAVVLLVLVAFTGCQGIQEAPGDELEDAQYTTIPTGNFTAPVTLEPEQTPPPPPGRYDAITLTDEEKDTLARVIWLEARGECFDGQQAVAEVVFNRMLSPDFPDTLDEVIYQRGQFSTASRVSAAEPTETQYIAIETALEGPNILPLEVVFFSQKGENDNVWGTIGGHVFCYPYTWEADN